MKSFQIRHMATATANKRKIQNISCAETGPNAGAQITTITDMKAEASPTHTKSDSVVTLRGAGQLERIPAHPRPTSQGLPGVPFFTKCIAKCSHSYSLWRLPHQFKPIFVPRTATRSAGIYAATHTQSTNCALFRQTPSFPQFLHLAQHPLLFPRIV